MNHLVLARSFRPPPPTKPGLSSLPSEILVMIIKRTDPMDVTCLFLTSKYFALHCLSVPTSATYPAKLYRYIDDHRRVNFLNLLKDWVPKKYRLCYICRKYRPINGGHLVDIVEQKYTPKELPLYKRLGSQATKNTPKTTLWKDEDWTFMSLGKRASKHGVMETRTYCPACVREVDNIKIGRRRMHRQGWKREVGVRGSRDDEDMGSDG
jgi:hypothetical protein